MMQSEEFFDAQGMVGGFFLDEARRIADYIQGAYQFFKPESRRNQEKFASLYQDYAKEHIHVFKNAEGKVSGYVAFDPEKKSAMVVYRGTKTVTDLVKTDCAFGQVKSNDCPANGNVAMGFQNDFESSWLQLCSVLDGYAMIHDIPIKKMNITVAGHSLGGALATLCTLRLRVRLGVETLRCLTLGSPRVFSNAMASFYESLNIPTLRVVQQYQDPVSAVSPGCVGYKHVGEPLIVSSHGMIPHKMDSYQEGLARVTEETFVPVSDSKSWIGMAMRYVSFAVRLAAEPLVAIPSVIFSASATEEAKDGFFDALDYVVEEDGGFIVLEPNLMASSVLAQPGPEIKVEENLAASTAITQALPAAIAQVPAESDSDWIKLDKSLDSPSEPSFASRWIDKGRALLKELYPSASPEVSSFTRMAPTSFFRA